MKVSSFIVRYVTVFVLIILSIKLMGIAIDISKNRNKKRLVVDILTIAYCWIMSMFFIFIKV